MGGRVALLIGFGVSCEIDDEISSKNAVIPVHQGVPDANISEVYSGVADHCMRYRYPEWIQDAVEKLSEGFDHVDVFTQGYDDFLDAALYDPQDGFDPVGSIYEGHGAYSVFDSELVFSTGSRNSINHLNGSVFMSRRVEPGSLGLMYKFDSPQRVSDTSDRSVFSDASLSPVLSCASFQEAFLFDPFRAYRAHFVQCLSCGRRLVVIGYGFEDPFINELLRSFASGDGNKVLFVSPEPPRMFDACSVSDGACVSDHVLWFNGTFRSISGSEGFRDFYGSFRSGSERVRE